MNYQVLANKVETYKFTSKPKLPNKDISKRQVKRRNKRLNWVDVRSEEFKKFVRNLKVNNQLTQPDQACTIWWGRVPYAMKQKHMEHWKYIIDSEFFKDAKTFLTLWKTHNLIDDSKVAIFEPVVPDTVYEWERDSSNTNQRFFANDLKNSQKLNIVAPVKHSTLLRNDVSVQRLLDENNNVKYHFDSECEKVKKSLIKNDETLQGIVTKLKSIMEKNDYQKKLIISMENSWLHLQTKIESKAQQHEYIEKLAESKIDSAKAKDNPKVPYSYFGVVYDTEEKQFMHKQKALRLKV